MMFLLYPDPHLFHNKLPFCPPDTYRLNLLLPCPFPDHCLFLPLRHTSKRLSQTIGAEFLLEVNHLHLHHPTQVSPQTNIPTIDLKARLSPLVVVLFLSFLCSRPKVFEAPPWSGLASWKYFARLLLKTLSCSALFYFVYPDQ